MKTSEKRLGVFQKHTICTSRFWCCSQQKKGSNFMDHLGSNSALAFQGVCPRVLGAMTRRPPQHDPCRVTLFGCHRPVRSGHSLLAVFLRATVAPGGRWSCLASTNRDPLLPRRACPRPRLGQALAEQSLSEGVNSALHQHRGGGPACGWEGSHSGSEAWQNLTS